MDRLINLYIAPKKVFTELRERPIWFLPLVVVLILVTAISILTVSQTKDFIIAEQEDAMRERGMPEEHIEQALRITSGPMLYIGAGINPIIYTIVILLLFSTVIKYGLLIFGIETIFKKVFAVVTFSSLVKIPACILRLVLILVTGSPLVSTSLTLFFPGLNYKSFWYRILSGFDFFMVWEMILVSLGITIITEGKKENAFILVFLVWIISIFIGASLGLLR